MEEKQKKMYPYKYKFWNTPLIMFRPNINYDAYISQWFIVCTFRLFFFCFFLISFKGHPIPFRVWTFLFCFCVCDLVTLPMKRRRRLHFFYDAILFLFFSLFLCAVFPLIWLVNANSATLFLLFSNNNQVLRESLNIIPPKIMFKIDTGVCLIIPQ